MLGDVGPSKRHIARDGETRFCQNILNAIHDVARG